jgi:hypothetical protein
MAMRPIDELEALDSEDPVQAQEAIDEAIAADQHSRIQARIEAGEDAARRTAISPKAVRPASRSQRSWRAPACRCAHTAGFDVRVYRQR